MPPPTRNCSGPPTQTTAAGSAVEATRDSRPLTVVANSLTATLRSMPSSAESVPPPPGRAPSALVGRTEPAAAPPVAADGAGVGHRTVARPRLETTRQRRRPHRRLPRPLRLSSSGASARPSFPRPFLLGERAIVHGHVPVAGCNRVRPCTRLRRHRHRLAGHCREPRLRPRPHPRQQGGPRSCSCGGAKVRDDWRERIDARASEQRPGGVPVPAVMPGRRRGRGDMAKLADCTDVSGYHRGCSPHALHAGLFQVAC